MDSPAPGGVIRRWFETASLQLKLKRPRAAVLILIVAGLLGYGSVLANGFIIDDSYLIVNSSAIRSLHNIPEFFTTSYLNYYRPLSTVSFALDYAVWQTHPLGYHLSNLSIHCLNSVLFFFLLLFLFGNFEFALLSGVLFAVHPLNGVPVNYVSDRGNLMAAFFMLAALLFFCRATLKTKPGYYYLFAFGSGFLALLCRESAVLFPAYLGCVFLVIGRREGLIRNILLVLAAGVLSWVYLAVRPDLSMLAKGALAPASLKGIDAYGYVVMKYFLLLIAPVDVSFYRKIPAVSFPLFMAILGFVLGAGVWVYTQRKNRPALFCAGWFMIGVLPLYRLMFLRKEIGLVMQDNWIYFSSIGLMGLGALFFLFLKQHARKVFVYGLFGVFFLFLLNADWRHNASFRDTPTYCTHWLKQLPGNPLALANLANYYCSAGEFNRALHYYELYRKYANPDFVKRDARGAMLYGAGVCYYELGDRENALAYFKKSIVVGRDSRDNAFFSIGQLYWKNNEHKQAFSNFKKAEREAVKIVRAGQTRPFLFRDSAKGKKRRTVYGILSGAIPIKKSERLNSLIDARAILRSLGRFYFEQQQWDGAIRCFEQVVRADPNADNSALYYDLGTIFSRRNDLPRAIDYYKKAAQSRKFSLPADYALSILYAKSGDLESAQRAMSAVVSRDPGYYDRKKQEQQLKLDRKPGE